MEPASIFYDSIEVNLKTGIDICDITADFMNIVTLSRVENGNLMATVTGSTGSLTTIEYEPGVVKDLKNAINRLAPPGEEYEHEKAWHDGNGHSHVQAALLGPSLVLPVRNGRIKLGTWQQVVLINHDNSPRSRIVEITIIGTRDK